MRLWQRAGEGVQAQASRATLEAVRQRLEASAAQVRYLVITPTMVRPSAAVRYLVGGESRERCAAYVP